MTSIKERKAKVLAYLYNHACCPGGMALFAYEPALMTEQTAAQLLEECEKRGSYYFDYLKGRVMKVDLSPDTLERLNFRLYDRDNGPGAGEWAVLDALTAPD